MVRVAKFGHLPISFLPYAAKRVFSTRTCRVWGDCPTLGYFITNTLGRRRGWEYNLAHGENFPKTFLHYKLKDIVAMVVVLRFL